MQGLLWLLLLLLPLSMLFILATTVFDKRRDKEMCVVKQKQKLYHFRKEIAIDLDFYNMGE